MATPQVAVYMAYRRAGEKWEFFCQMRDSHAPTHPNMFSAFGGQIEAGEDSRAAVIREVNEELAYMPRSLRLFPQQFVSDVNGKIFDVYTEEVGPDFENFVTVLEGEYGCFLEAEDIAVRSDVSIVSKEIVAAICASLDQESAEN